MDNSQNIINAEISRRLQKLVGEQATEIVALQVNLEFYKDQLEKLQAELSKGPDIKQKE